MNPTDDRVRDISNSPAYTHLDELLKQGKLTRARVELFKSQYQKLHEVVIATYSNEKLLLDKAKELKQLLEGERDKLERKIVVSHDTQADIELLQKEEKETSIELSTLREERDMVDAELAELELNKKERASALEEKYRSSLAALKPEIEKLEAKIIELKGDIKDQEASYEKENQAVAEYTEKIEQAQADITSIDKEKIKKRAQYNQAVGEPERLKSNIEMIENIAKDLQADADNLLKNIKEYEHKINDLSKDKMTASQTIEQLKVKEVQLQQEIGKKKACIEDRERDYQYEISRAQELRERKEAVELDTVQQKDNLRNNLESLNAFHKKCEEQKKMYERLRRKRDTVQSIIPPLTNQYEILDRQLEEMKYQHKLQKEMLTEIKQDEELFISQYLAQEKLEEDTVMLLTSVDDDRKDYEKKIVELDKEERLLQQHISKLSSQRELMAREASRATALFRETKEDLKVKNLILMDLDKQTMETFQRLKTCSMKYEKMKNQRNKLANLTQSSSQALAEMKEKIKILQNEVEILRNESLARDRGLQEEVRIHQQAQNARDAHRVEQNKKQQYLAKKKEEDNQQLMEIEKLNMIVNSAEKQMIRLRTDYAQAVDARNKTGIHLIDRNDELCILYEKSNIQKAIVKKGDEELSGRQNEIRMVKVEEAALRRKIEVARKEIPSLQVYAATTKQLQHVEASLNDERKQTQELCEKLETPSGEEGPPKANTAEQVDPPRCRKLGGMDPETEQLAAKIEVLEERLNDKKEQLLEKELVLDEVTGLSDKLRMQAAESRGPTLDLAKKVNEYQAKIRGTTRKMMATVSELSMYQATAMKLEHQKRAQGDELTDARGRLGEGMAPTEDAEHEWYRMERDRMRRQESLMERKADAAAAQAAASIPGMTRTTAEPRPNAYIPEELGIPKPYGHLAPYKPTVLGANMRHIRKPVPKEIEL